MAEGTCCIYCCPVGDTFFCFLFLLVIYNYIQVSSATRTLNNVFFTHQRRLTFVEEYKLEDFRHSFIIIDYSGLVGTGFNSRAQVALVCP